MKKQKFIAATGLALLVVLSVLVTVQGIALYKLYQEKDQQQARQAEAMSPEVPALQFEPRSTASQKPPQAATPPQPRSLFDDPFFHANGTGTLDPFERMRQMRAEMDALFGDFGLGSFDMSFADLGSGMGLQVQEENDAYVITLNIGADEVENLDIQVNDRQLSVSGTSHRSVEQRDANGSVSRQQRSRQFSQSFTLPGAVKAEELKSDFKDGVLTITLPKDSAAVPHGAGPRSLV